jgi:hypothetical protein
MPVAFTDNCVNRLPLTAYVNSFLVPPDNTPGALPRPISGVSLMTEHVPVADEDSRFAIWAERRELTHIVSSIKIHRIDFLDELKKLFMSNMNGDKK